MFSVSHVTAIFGLILVLAGIPGFVCAEPVESWIDEANSALVNELVERYGEDERVRASTGLMQTAAFWREEDGDREAYENLVRDNFAGDQETLNEVFTRFEFLLEKFNGHALQIVWAMRWQTDLEVGRVLPMDRVAAGYNPANHLKEDFFANKLAFVTLLNFPRTTLEQKLTDGHDWSRRQWAETRLADEFLPRVPTAVQQAQSRAMANADQYIADYNIWMHHLIDQKGDRLFPAGMKLLTHWNLRDQIKADYSDKEDGLAKQRMVLKVMERIVDQSIPEEVINNPGVDWDPYDNKVRVTKVRDSEQELPTYRTVSHSPEPNTRYAIWLANFKAQRLEDEYSPAAPTHIQRVFDVEREIPEARVEEMFHELLSSPLRADVAKLIEQRLGRSLEPFDIWYNGFLARGAYTEAELGEITRRRYPDAMAYEKDIPRMLHELGFEKKRADELAANIAVDPARGSGHAWGSAMRGVQTRLRTRVGEDGMDYKGYNIAVHEMGHNVEQTLSLEEIDYYSLEGVPNTAFTEALAFVFQARDLELLGLSSPNESAATMRVLDDFWGAAEIASVALVDMRVWRWLYKNENATAAELRDAVVGIAGDVWNQYYAELFGQRDVILLGVYSHMINNELYLPNYPIGSLIAIQIEEQIGKAGDLGGEFERMCKTGNVTPDQWMIAATGAPVGPQAMLSATRRALDELDD